MRGGDISNETPRRLIVVIDVIGSSEVEEDKKLLRRSVTKRSEVSYDNRVLSYLWNFSSKHGLSVELVAFADEVWEQSDLDRVMARLDGRGANPFNHAEVYPSVEDFINDLPYRPNLQGVVDMHPRAARYGSWYFSLNL
jgi:hypothetical protein